MDHIHIRQKSKLIDYEGDDIDVRAEKWRYFVNPEKLTSEMLLPRDFDYSDVKEWHFTADDYGPDVETELKKSFRMTFAFPVE